MIIHGEHNIKLLEKSLLVLVASIDASLRYCVERDLAAGYIMLKENANTLLQKIVPLYPTLTIKPEIEKRTAVIALNKLIDEYTTMGKDVSRFITLYNNLVSKYTNTEQNGKQEKTPAILNAWQRDHRPDVPQASH